jgi:hypothetical protein
MLGVVPGLSGAIPIAMVGTSTRGYEILCCARKRLATQRMEAVEVCCCVN